MASVNASIEQVVAAMCGDAAHEVAEGLGAQAEGALAQHRDTGAARIEVTRGRKDSFVELVDEGALSIEFGNQYAPGLSILGRLL